MRPEEGNLLNIYYTLDKYFKISVRKRSNRKDYEFDIRIPDPSYQNNIRNVASRIHARNIIKFYSWNRVQVCNLAGESINMTPSF
jgi:hypothetical protein